MNLCKKCVFPCFPNCAATYADIEYGGKGTAKDLIIQCDKFQFSNANEPRGVWAMDKSIEDFKQIAYNLKREGSVSRADAVMYLIERIKIAEGRCLGLHEMEGMRNDIKDLILLYAENIKETQLYEQTKPPDLDEVREKYNTDPVFHSKVYSLVGPLFTMVNRYLR